MLSRLLVGAGLALLAAQLVAQGHVCGPGCSGSGNGQDAPRFDDSSPLPPDRESAYSRGRRSDAFIDPRSMMLAPAVPFSQGQWSQPPSVFDAPTSPYSPAPYPPNQSQLGNRDRCVYGHHHRRGHARWRDQASAPHGNFDSFRQYETPPRDFERSPLPLNEDSRPMPQPSLTPQSRGFRGGYPMPMPQQQPGSLQRPRTSPERGANAWNI